MFWSGLICDLNLLYCIHYVAIASYTCKVKVDPLRKTTGVVRATWNDRDHTHGALTLGAAAGGVVANESSVPIIRFYSVTFCMKEHIPLKKPSTKVSLKYSGLDLKRYIYFLFTTAPLYDLISNLTHPVGASGSRSCRFHHFTPLASVKWLTPALTDAPVLLWLRHARKSVGLYKKTWKKREGCTVA